nr:4-alpha-L-fucosyltransferase glycosyl transferase group 56 [Plesiomonas shigelloides]
MKNGKILHLGSAGKFVASHYQMIEESFDILEHEFYLLDGMASKEFSGKENAKIFKRGLLSFVSYIKMTFSMIRSRKVILHGLNDPRVIFILYFFPSVINKAYWIIWGGDLYSYQLDIKDWKWKIKEYFRRSVIKNMGHLVTYIPGDVELARKWYGAKGEYHECLMYMSNVIDARIIQAAHDEMEEHLGITILVGNSAAPSNNHIESLEKLLPYKEDKIKIFVPLSYGDQEYAQTVIETGKAWFGDKFIPLTAFMEFDEYLKLLTSIDIAIFNHKRQQAMGNIITLLGMGKTVFIRSGVSHYDFLKGLGLNLHSINEFNLKTIDKEDARANSKVVGCYFSKKKLKHQLSCVFDG